MASNGPILVVDDDRAIRDFVRLALEDAGYQVVVATDGAEALEAIRRGRPRLILLDMRMPGMNGWEFAEAYRAAPSPHAPIVMMTAGPDAQAKATDIGAAGWLGKPFDLDQLVATVARFRRWVDEVGVRRAPRTTPPSPPAPAADDASSRAARPACIGPKAPRAST